jgi:hypothetical protein
MNVIGFIVSLALFLLGMFLFGQAFVIDSGQAIMFFGGIVSVCVAIALPIHILKRVAP